MTAYGLLHLLSAPVMLVGLGTAYLGLAIFRLYLAVFGLLVGGLLGLVFAFGEAASSASTDLLLFLVMPIVFGIGGFLLANLIQRFVTIFVGFVGGAAIGVVLAIGFNSDALLAIVLSLGVIGAVVAIVMETWMIILSTSATGAALVSLPLILVMFDETIIFFFFSFVFITGIVFQHRLFVSGEKFNELSSVPGTDISTEEDDPYSLSNLER